MVATSSAQPKRVTEPEIDDRGQQRHIDNHDLGMPSVIVSRRRHLRCRSRLGRLSPGVCGSADHIFQARKRR